MKLTGDRWWMALCGVSLVVGFGGGYWISELGHEDRVHAEARRQSDEFLLGSIRLGIVRIDEDRLAELTKAAAEGEPDADSEGRCPRGGSGGDPLDRRGNAHPQGRTR